VRRVCAGLAADECGACASESLSYGGAGQNRPVLYARSVAILAAPAATRGPRGGAPPVVVCGPRKRRPRPGEALVDAATVRCGRLASDPPFAGLADPSITWQEQRALAGQEALAPGDAAGWANCVGQAIAYTLEEAPVPT